jgi:mannose-6-phosphate isomerase-like protein (cupin superfamily)
MALHKDLLRQGFKLPSVEKHFHDCDETWLILAGRGTGYWIDHDGTREEFLLESGDVWMIPAGYEHGSNGFEATGRNSDDFMIEVFMGTQAPGSQEPRHLYMENERYLPSLRLVKAPIDRYPGATAPPKPPGADD